VALFENNSRAMKLDGLESDGPVKTKVGAIAKPFSINVKQQQNS